MCLEEKVARYISVIVPCYNEESYIEEFINSILDQDYPKDRMELIFIDGLSSDKSREKLQSISKEYNFIRILDNHSKYVPYALNLGIDASIGEVIIRMDVHSSYPKNYLSRLVEMLYVLNADNVGGVLEILPSKGGIMNKCIVIGMVHKFGTGNAPYKNVDSTKIRPVDTVPFGCFRRELFTRIGLFDVDLIRNQDDEFNGRIIKNGGKIYLIPDLVIKYYARDSIEKMNKMFYQYGLFKPLVNKKLGAPATFRQLVPPLFVSMLLFGALLCIFNVHFRIIYLLLVLFYLFVCLCFSFIEAKKQKNLSFLFLLPSIFLLIHVSYGIGYIVGIFKFTLCNQGQITISTSR